MYHSFNAGVTFQSFSEIISVKISYDFLIISIEFVLNSFSAISFDVGLEVCFCRSFYWF